LAKVKVVKDTAERWLLTYADLMNLLLIFFIILYAISQVDQQKAQQLSQSMRAAFGQASGETIIGKGMSGNSIAKMDNKDEAPPSSVVEGTLEKEQMNEVKKKVEDIAKKTGLIDQVGVTLEERGVRISISSTLLFKKSSDEIEPAALPTVRGIGDVLRNIPDKPIRIEGHTDSDQINTERFPSNWELSSARANKVLRFFVENSKISPKIISSVGFGEYRPLVPNTTEANKSKNRRVDIVIIKSMYDATEPGEIGANKTEPPQHSP
jgi:chemotaxis protein MotB